MCKTVSIDHYLKAIYIIQHEKGFVRNIDIAAALGYTKPSVTRAVTVLKEMEYITVTGHEIRLTANGQKEALKLLEKYKTICDFLKSLGVSDASASHDACEMDHHISDETYRHLKQIFAADTLSSTSLTKSPIQH